MNEILAVVGKSCTGKSKIARYISFRYNIPIVNTVSKVDPKYNRMICITNPAGIKLLKELYETEYTIKELYLYSPEEVIIERALLKGYLKKDIEEILKTEREEFDLYIKNSYKLITINTDKSLSDIYGDLYYILEFKLNMRK